MRAGDWLKKPHEWRKERKTRLSHYAAASVIYRWEDHAYHYGPLQLSGEDYDKALAALSPPYHEPAMGMKEVK